MSEPLNEAVPVLLTRIEVENEMADLVKYLCPKCIEVLSKVLLFRKTVNPNGTNPTWAREINK